MKPLCCYLLAVMLGGFQPEMITFGREGGVLTEASLFIRLRPFMDCMSAMHRHR